MAGPSTPQVQLGFCLPRLCYKPFPSPDLCSMFSVEEPCPLQEWGFSPASPSDDSQPTDGDSRWQVNVTRLFRLLSRLWVVWLGV